MILITKHTCNCRMKNYTYLHRTFRTFSMWLITTNILTEFILFQKVWTKMNETQRNRAILASLSTSVQLTLSTNRSFFFGLHMVRVVRVILQKHKILEHHTNLTASMLKRRFILYMYHRSAPVGLSGIRGSSLQHS